MIPNSILTTERYEHSVIFIHPNPGVPGDTVRLIQIIREQTSGRFFLMKHGDVTTGIPANGEEMTAYVFSTSNCIYTGMPLQRYELMLRVWKDEGNFS